MSEALIHTNDSAARLLRFMVIMVCGRLSSRVLTQHAIRAPEPAAGAEGAWGGMNGGLTLENAALGRMPGRWRLPRPTRLIQHLDFHSMVVDSILQLVVAGAVPWREADSLASGSAGRESVSLREGG
jgi:hypothetical protein